MDDSLNRPSANNSHGNVDSMAFFNHQTSTSAFGYGGRKEMVLRHKIAQWGGIKPSVSTRSDAEGNLAPIRATIRIASSWCSQVKGHLHWLEV